MLQIFWKGLLTMAGMNVPKPSARAARRGGGNETVVQFSPVDQPGLPEGIEWPEQTVKWWGILGDSPLAPQWTEEDWQYLTDTALIHADVWGGGNFDCLSELRIRVERFGVTPAARASLRIQLAEADIAEVRQGKTKRKTADEGTKRYGQLRAVSTEGILKKEA